MKYLNKPGWNAIAFAMAVSIPLIAYVDVATGRDFSLSAFYLIPISLIAWIWGPVAGIASALVSAAAGVVTDDLLAKLWRPRLWIVFFNEIVRAAIFVAFAGMTASARRALSRARYQERERARANAELRAFNYAVAHHLRAPVRACRAAVAGLPQDLSDRIESNARRMEDMIDGLLAMARIGETEFRRVDVDLSELARHVAVELGEEQPDLRVDCRIQSGVRARGDRELLRLLMRRLFDNAWKFTSRASSPMIEFGTQDGRPPVYFVKDNGVGFDMRHADKLFQPFQRLHGRDEFPGLGVGLVVAERIVHRHGGRIWATGETGKGAGFYFTLAEDS